MIRRPSKMREMPAQREILVRVSSHAPPSHRTVLHDGSSSRRVGLEPFGLLAVANEGNYGFDVLSGKSYYGRHRSKVPMVGGYADHDGDQESAVTVVTRLVHLREKRRALVGSSQVGAMTLGAIGGVQVGPGFHQFRIGCDDPCPLGSSACGNQSEGGEHHQQVSQPHSPGFRSSRRRNWALMATMTVEALMSTAATAGPRTMPAHASAPAASGIAAALYPVAQTRFWIILR